MLKYRIKITAQCVESEIDETLGFFEQEYHIPAKYFTATLVEDVDPLLEPKVRLTCDVGNEVFLVGGVRND